MRHLSPAQRAQDARDTREIRMIPRVSRRVPPENQVVPHQKKPRHGPGVANRFAAHMPLQGGPESGQPHRRSEQLPFAALADPEGGIESLWGIGNGARLLPVQAEECGTLCNCALVNKQQRGVGGIGSAGSA